MQVNKDTKIEENWDVNENQELSRKLESEKFGHVALHCPGE